jgi:hypothetical protein
MDEFVEQLRAAMETSAKLSRPYQSFHKELCALYEKVKRAHRRRPDSPDRIR